MLAEAEADVFVLCGVPRRRSTRTLPALTLLFNHQAKRLLLDHLRKVNGQQMATFDSFDFLVVDKLVSGESGHPSSVK